MEGIQQRIFDLGLNMLPYFLLTSTSLPFPRVGEMSKGEGDNWP